jgi:hypothetical protein
MCARIILRDSSDRFCTARRIIVVAAHAPNFTDASQG